MWGCAWRSQSSRKPSWCSGQEEASLVCLMSLRTNQPPALPKLNPRRALFVLSKIDEILSWEKRVEANRDTKFVELGRYLCEVRAGQYWRVENLKSFDEFLERRFPESRRKAYYLMSIHEHLPPQVRKELKQVGWAQSGGVDQSGAFGREGLRLCNLVAQSACAPEGAVQTRGGEAPHGQGHRTDRDHLFQALQEPDPRC